jgi:DUF971 family protein
MPTTGSNQHRPVDLTINRSEGTLEVDWADGHKSSYRLGWLRTVCPCASCLDDRRQAELDPLRLMSGPLPSTVVEDAEFVGNYAIRFTWADGHANGIYGFASLRASCPCQECNEREPEALLSEL